MVDALLKYVEDRIRAGHAPNIIKADLVRQGYSPALVDGIMDSIMIHGTSTGLPGALPAGASTSNHKGLHAVFTIIAVFIIIIGAVFFVPGLLKSKQALLDVSATPEKQSYSAGETLGFNLEVFNMGTKDRFDITLNYRVIDSQDNMVASQEESIAISTSTSYYKKMALPTSLRPGKYTLKAFANYDEKIATSSFTFDIINKEEKPIETCSDGKKNQDETNIDCGGTCKGYWYNNKCNSMPQTTNTENTSTDNNAIEQPAIETCSDGKQNQDETNIDCGGTCKGYWYNNKCNTQPEQVITPPSTGDDFITLLSQAQAQAKTDPEGAKTICLKMSLTQAKDKCYKAIAESSMENEYCEPIEDYDMNDACYAIFYMKGDYSVCEKMALYENRKSCEQLRDISRVAAELEKENYAAVSGIMGDSTSLDFFAD